MFLRAKVPAELAPPPERDVEGDFPVSLIRISTWSVGFISIIDDRIVFCGRQQCDLR
jgi:hypothetical protein